MPEGTYTLHVDGRERTVTYHGSADIVQQLDARAGSEARSLLAVRIQLGCILLGMRAQMARGDWYAWLDFAGVNRKKATRSIALHVGGGTTDGTPDRDRLFAACRAVDPDRFADMQDFRPHEVSLYVAELALGIRAPQAARDRHTPKQDDGQGPTPAGPAAEYRGDHGLLLVTAEQIAEDRARLADDDGEDDGDDPVVSSVGYALPVVRRELMQGELVQRELGQGELTPDAQRGTAEWPSPPATAKTVQLTLASEYQRVRDALDRASRTIDNGTCSARLAQSLVKAIDQAMQEEQH